MKTFGHITDPLISELARQGKYKALVSVLRIHSSS